MLQKLQEKVELLPSDNSLKGCTIDKVTICGDDTPSDKGHITRSGKPSASKRKNIFIFDHNGDACIAEAYECLRDMGVSLPNKITRSGGTCLYCTYNTYIGERDDADSNSEVNPNLLKTVFHLARIKHAFVVHYTTASGKRRIDRLGGELIDVSMSAGINYDEASRWMKESSVTLYRNYPVLGVDHPHLRSYTVEGFLNDFTQMIHYHKESLHKAKKLDKRVTKYVAFLVCHTFSPSVQGSFDAKKRALEKLRDGFSDFRNSTRSFHSGVPVVDSFWRTHITSMRHLPENNSIRYYLSLVHDTLSIFSANLSLKKSGFTPLIAARRIAQYNRILVSSAPSKTLPPDASLQQIQSALDRFVLTTVPEFNIRGLSLFRPSKRFAGQLA